MSLTWIALLVGLLAVVGSIVYLVRRTIELWRAIKAFFVAAGDHLDTFSRSVDTLASREDPDFERLQAALERLRRSSARLAVLRSAVDRVRAQTAGTLFLYPRK